MKLTASTEIACDLSQLWSRTQTPDQHVRWDLRFTDIEYVPKLAAGAPQRFRYRTRIGAGLAIEGWGETVARRDGRGSVLRFASEDPKSLIREGKGCWIYEPVEGRVRFSTVYDYGVRFGALGKLIDRLLFRPLMIWATRWSFDRLRLWLERGLAPELARGLWLTKLAARLTLGVVWVMEGLVPKILVVHAAEVDLVRRSGLFWLTPEHTLAVLGVIEAVAGLLLFIGWAERLGAVLSSAAVVVLTGLVLCGDPEAVTDPYGGLVKNLGLLACAGVVWALEPVTPKARRANGHRRKPHTDSGGRIPNGTAETSRSPFAAALGSQEERLAPRVREHFLMAPGRRRYRGVMTRVWRCRGWRGWLARPFLHVGSWTDTLFPQTGERILFDLEHVVAVEPSGAVTMTWDRTFHFPGKPRRFSAVMRFDPRRGVLVDRLGRTRHLEVELHARAEGGALCLRSGRQWVHAGPLRLPVPHWFAGEASVKEWERDDGSLGICVRIRNPLLGEFFGYEGFFGPREAELEPVHPEDRSSASQEIGAPFNFVSRVQTASR